MVRTEWQSVPWAEGQDCFSRFDTAFAGGAGASLQVAGPAVSRSLALGGGCRQRRQGCSPVNVVVGTQAAVARGHSSCSDTFRVTQSFCALEKWTQSYSQQLNASVVTRSSRSKLTGLKSP